MKIITNLLISLLAFVIAISIAVATGIELVFNAVFLAFAIQWIAFIPAYIFQTEKFYDLTGSLTYLSVIWYSLALSSDQFTNINGANIAIVLLIVCRFASVSGVSLSVISFSVSSLHADFTTLSSAYEYFTTPLEQNIF